MGDLASVIVDEVEKATTQNRQSAKILDVFIEETSVRELVFADVRLTRESHVKRVLRNRPEVTPVRDFVSRFSLAVIG